MYNSEKISKYAVDKYVGYDDKKQDSNSASRSDDKYKYRADQGHHSSFSSANDAKRNEHCTYKQKHKEHFHCRECGTIFEDFSIFKRHCYEEAHRKYLYKKVEQLAQSKKQHSWNNDFSDKSNHKRKE